MKRTRVIVLILVLVLSQFAIGFADDALAVQKERQYKQAEYDGVVAYNEIMKAFSESGTTVTAAQVKENSVKLEPVFPESYGGAYTDPETGKLVVCLTKDETEITAFKNDVKQIVENTELSSSNNVVYKDVTYSYNTLMKVVEEILPAFVEEEKRNGEHTVSAFYTRFTENQVVVILDDVNDCNKRKVAEYVNNALALKENTTALLNFKEKQGKYKEEASVNPGGEVSILVRGRLGNEYSSGSIGFRAKKVENGVTKYGFVTAAHVMKNHVTDEWKKGGGTLTSTIGITDDSAYQEDVDAVFVELLSGHTATTDIENYSKDHWTVGHFLVTEGLTVYKSGCETDCTSGPVISASYEDADAGIRDVILADYDSVGGDSGGTVFYDGGGEKVFIVGIHRAAYDDAQSDLSGKIVCKAANVLDALNISFW